MKKILRFLFNRYRSTFEDLFIEDIFGDIPPQLTENAMKFLLGGGTSFNKWMRLNSYNLQRKLQQSLKDNGSVYIGGLIFFKTLDTMIARLSMGQSITPVDEPPASSQIDLEQANRGVDEFFSNKK